MQSVRVCKREFALRFAAITLGVMGGVVPSMAPAQTVVQGGTGVEFRFRGDTIWRQRDTTMSRTVYRGDTVYRTTYVFGALRFESSYALKGDSAYTIYSRDAKGVSLFLGNELRVTPSTIVVGERDMVVMALRQQVMEARMPEMSSFRASREPPQSPPDLRHYAFSANRNIEQHGDTVRYITGCKEVGTVSTNVFQMFGADSVRRLSPDPRTFDSFMVRAIRADMASSMTRSNMTMTEGDFHDVPGPNKWPCDKR